MDAEGPAPDWVALSVPTSAQLLGVWGRTSTEAYAVGWDGTALRWDGARWTEETTTATVPLTDVGGAPEGGPVFAVGWDGTILARDPTTATWGPASRTATTSRDLFGVHLVAPDDGLLVGDAGAVLGWDGGAWSPVDFAVESELSGDLVRPRTALAGVWSADGRRWIMTGAGGQSFRSRNGVARFESLDTRESIPLRGVWGPDPGTTYTVGLEGIVLRLTNRWRRDGADLPDAFLFGIWGRSDDDITAVGWQGTLLRRFEGTWRTETAEREVDLRDVWVDDGTGRAFAVGARGTILTRTGTAAP
jgi:photosystem II stability/assembly factor-like uncharacterized protein